MTTGETVPLTPRKQDTLVLFEWLAKVDSLDTTVC